MKYKKVILANFVAHEKNFWSRRAVLRSGLGYIAQSLYNNGIEYIVMDFALGYSINELLKKIKLFQPDLLAISMFTYKYAEAYEKIKKVKKEFKELKIVCGGPHITTYGESALTECSEIDYGIKFEGENAILDLCSGKDLRKIPGLIYRENSKIINNPNPTFIENLDSIPFPEYHNFELENYPIRNSSVNERIIPLVTSRGCPYNCIYCTVKSIMGKKFRTRSVENVISEIEYWYNKGYRKFSIVDDNFTLIRSRVLEFCQKIKDKGFENLYFLLQNGIRADKIDYELLVKMYDTGFREIGVGVESSQNQILKMLNKNENIETIEKAIKNLCEIGFAVDLYFIVGSPGETFEDVLSTAEFSCKYPVNYVFFFNLIPYPKTTLFDWVRENGKFIYEPEYYLNKINSSMNKPVFETPEFSAKERKKALITAKKTFKDFKRKSYFNKLKSRGAPKIIAYLISKIYSLYFVQILVNDIQIFRYIKERLWQKNSFR